MFARADDSSGIIGDACRRLLALHSKAAVAAQVPTARLVDWTMKFQFDDEVDFFELDPVAYSLALGQTERNAYRARLDEVHDRLGPRPDDRWPGSDRREWSVLEWNGLRLTVFDHDVDAIHPYPRERPESRHWVRGHHRTIRGDR